LTLSSLEPQNQVCPGCLMDQSWTHCWLAGWAKKRDMGGMASSF